MKHIFKSILLWFGLSGLSGVVCAAPSVFNNYGVIDTPTNISAVHFNNFGAIGFTTGNVRPYDTYNTSYFTSTGTMDAVPGFRFADVDSATGKIRPAVSFINSGVISGVDTAAGIEIFFGSGGSSYVIPNDNQPIPSQLTVNAANVVNSGTLSVGNDGTMGITGQNVDLSYGSLVAGNLLSTNQSSIFESESAEQYLLVPGSTPPKYYTQDVTGTFDLLWGVTNGLLGSVVNIITADTNGDGFYSVDLPGVPGTTNRGGFVVTQPIIDTGLAAYVYQYSVPPGQTTNIYYDVVLVKNRFADPNMSVNVQFAPGLPGFNYVPFVPMTGNPNGFPILVTFSEKETDPVSGEAVTDSIFLEDDGDTLNPVTLALNAAYSAAYSRPDAFELTYTAPPLIPAADWVPANTTLSLGNIYAPGQMSPTAYMSNSVYGVQIGNNPESLTGSFPALSGLEPFTNDIPAPSNAPGRITINANNLNLHNLKLTAQGLVIINGTNVTGLPTIFNYGTADVNLGARTNTLMVSNLVPVLFEQLRGNMEAWEGTWDNMQTNDVATNDIHTHVLYVGENLSALYTPTIRKFFLKSTNIFLQDSVEVIQQAVFNGRNLTLNTNLLLTQGAANLTPAGTPNLKNLLITTTGVFEVDSLLDIGFNIAHPVAATSPIGRTYSVLTVTNQGLIVATAPTIQARTIENDGIINTINGGSVVLAANTLGLGLSGGSTNSIVAGGAVTLSANSIEVTNSTIDANQIVMTPVHELTDFVVGTLGTNIIDGVSDLDNFWTVNNALTLTRKPALGDLYGTEIKVTSKGGSPTIVTWAGADKGDTLAGFQNNAVIGHLILDRTVNSAVLQFNAAGSKNALYVNYLELRDASLSDYRDNLVINPHLKIYFASANVPVNKLTNVSPQLVYAANSLATEAASPSPLLHRSSPASSGTVAALIPAITPPAGVYSGLFSPATGTASDDSGYLTLTLSKNGAFSGRVLLGASAFPFSSKLNRAGVGAFGVGSLFVSFAIDSDGNLLGAVTGEGWDAVLTGAVTPASPSPYVGHYALALPAPDGNSASPGTVGKVTVSALGVLTATGRLADGAAFSQSTHVTPDGQWPFFTYAAAGKDVLQGWMSFSADPSGLSGNVTWIKPGKAAGAYPQGVDVTVQVVGTAAK